jgi:hypothetical protein
MESSGIERCKEQVKVPDVNNAMYISKYSKWLNEFKRKYKLNFIFDVLNLILSVSCIATYIFTTYNPSTFSNNQGFFWYNFLSRIYFLIDLILTILTTKDEKKLEFYMYLIEEIITIFPFIFVRISGGLNEDYTNTGYLLTNALICVRFYRIQYLSKYIVFFLILGIRGQ